ncbi:MAG TPA: adenylate/guanylate cyclase domain-containing protein [Acidimicrobiia bacterium]|nr:adenylate/guanylate cyclase domain-containing protein [Acidimicrobiia bacterium]
MSPYNLDDAAGRAGVRPESVARLTQLGIVSPDGQGRFSDADVRTIQVMLSLERAGMALEGVAALIRGHEMSLDFIEAAGQYVFAPLSDATFATLSERTGIPVEVLLIVREAVGGGQPTPNDRVREDELAIVPLVELQYGLGFSPRAIERGLRVYGDSLRRVAEAEAEWWRSEIQEPMLTQGKTEDDVGRRAAEISPRLSAASDQAVMAVYHGQQMHAWSVNIVNGFARALESAGLHTREERPPAMCFLDISGYTRLTQERGDSAAADLAEGLRRIVQRSAVQHGGRSVKWLGDGVMFYFPDPGAGVVAALAMVEAVTREGLPQAHVGLHAGPVVFQEGDFYGQTVNIAARIGDYARPGEVLVSQEVVEASDAVLISFRDIGPVELKGVAGGVRLYAAESTASPL